jgi:hypothetical protein
VKRKAWVSISKAIGRWRDAGNSGLSLLAAVMLAACGDSAATNAADSLAGAALGSQAIALTASSRVAPASARDTSGPALPAGDYTLFEADPVRPIAVLERSRLVAVANAVDDYVELVSVDRDGSLTTCGGVRVGLRPVALAVVKETRRAAELWVVNHLSDSISVVRVDTERCDAALIDTLHVGDEPRDIVLATGADGRQSAFVSTAHRGQHHPVESARSGHDLVTPAGEKEHAGLADVFVFDTRRRALRGVVNLFTETLRALAAGEGVVYAAGFQTGNRSTLIMAERVFARGLTALEPLLLRQGGRFVERDGELVLAEGVAGRARMEGGMPAVAGRGRCVPDPRDDRADRFFTQVCVQTDAEQRVERVLLETSGEVHEGCQCTSGDGTLQPTTGVIVRFHDSEADCGRDFTAFPDGSTGCWLDATPGGVLSPAAHADAQPVPMSWNADVRFTLPDQDVFAIDVESLSVERAVSGVGTVIYGLAVQPGTGRAFAANTEALNLARFEGAGAHASTTVRGHLHESRISIIDSRGVTPVHLNGHIDYSRCCERQPGENEQSLAFPTSLAFSRDGRELYFTALGSDALAIVDARRLGPGFDNAQARAQGALRDVRLGASIAEPAGPVGLALDPERGIVYVKTHFTNELVAIDPDAGEIVGRVSFASPEPPSITRGRPLLYDARRTSSHGDSACASCHVFGNFDGLAWDLGDPDAASARNPGPFAQGAALFGLSGLVRDPFSTQIVGRRIVEDFRSNKGPMSTQTLRGLANHGAMHWRGDRTRRFQDSVAQQPDTGSLDENNSFNEFDVAIVGLNGNDAPLPPAEFQRMTDFALQLTLPPNPVRALDNSLSPQQARARAEYFGCSSMTDAELAARECRALDGASVEIEAETQACTCSKHPLLPMLRDLPRAVAFLGELHPLSGDSEARARIVAAATQGSDLPTERAVELSGIARSLDAAFVALAGAELALDDEALLPAAQSAAVEGLVLAFEALREAAGAIGIDLEGRLFEAVQRELAAPDAGSPEVPSVAAVAAGFRLAIEVGRVNAAVLADRAAAGTGAGRDLLRGCRLDTAYTCRLRVVDSVTTCHGCHTLDARGNAELGVYRPGFFGASGMYSFESESQIFKIPHLRNAYTKVGMFGVGSNVFLPPNSVLGDRRGGFPSLAGVFMGPQVRGFGFFHDGGVDTLHHFFGSAPFAARPPGVTSPRDPGNLAAFQTVLPALEDRAACVAELRAISDARFAEMPPGLELCRAASPVPDLCFLEPASAACAAALAAIGAERGDPQFAATFLNVRPSCFRMGSTLQAGEESGSCAPEGLRERTDMEAFVLAFDTNLEPMVGQQLTLADDEAEPPLLAAMLGVAERGGCDVAARQGARGYLMLSPRPTRPGRSVLRDASDDRRTLAELRRRDEPITLTCYPPQPGRAEARRTAFSR